MSEWQDNAGEALDARECFMTIQYVSSFSEESFLAKESGWRTKEKFLGAFLESARAEFVIEGVEM